MSNNILGVKNVTNNFGEQFYPVTTTDAVYEPDPLHEGVENKRNLESILADKPEKPTVGGGQLPKIQ